MTEPTLPPPLAPPAGGADCYWEKTTRSGDIIDNDLPSGPSAVIIDASAFTFSSQRCGEWTKVG